MRGKGDEGGHAHVFFFDKTHFVTHIQTRTDMHQVLSRGNACLPANSCNQTLLLTSSFFCTCREKTHDLLTYAVLSLIHSFALSLSHSHMHAHKHKHTHTHTHTGSQWPSLALWLFQRYNEIIVASQLNGPASQIRRRHHVPMHYALAANVSVHDAPCVLV